MSWTIADREPRELHSHGYDASLWEWRLRDTDSDAESRPIVFISGTAMATANEHLPEVVERAKATQGRSAVELFLDWVIPPERIELGTTSERPRVSGGLRHADGSDEGLLKEITRWFSEREIELVVEQRGDHWTAIMLPRGVRIGSADYGVGQTASEAAEDARRRYQTGGPRPLTARRET